MENMHNGKVVYHSDFGAGRIVDIDSDRIVVNFIKTGVKMFSKEDAQDELSETPFDDSGPRDDFSQNVLKEIFRKVLYEEGLIGATPLSAKWEGGEILLKPGKQDLQPKSVPVDVFFHKIVMIRNQLRILEQNINVSKNLSDREKVDMQQYITRCYGSLTTFNVLFADKEDCFVGARGD